MAKMSPLRRRMIEDMTLRNLSRQTQQSYIYAVAKFSRHFNRPPDRLGMEDVRAYQLHLVGQKLRVATIFDGLALAMIDGEVSLEGEVDGVSGFRFPSRV